MISTDPFARAEIHSREEQVLKLRLAGATFFAIAKQIGFATPSGAQQAYRRALRRSIAPQVDELRKIEGGRLDALQLGLWQKAMNGDVRAAETVVRIMERRAKLFGLDAPIHKIIEVVTEDVLDRAIRELEKEFDDIDMKAVLRDL